MVVVDFGTPLAFALALMQADRIQLLATRC